MESFKITTSWSDAGQKVLVIPDDCTDKSIFHLVKDGSEYCKLAYTDSKQWQVLEDGSLSHEELEVLTKKIEEHYF